MYKVQDVMTCHVFTITTDKSVMQAAELMKEKEIGGLPVIEDSELVGIITSKDIRYHNFNRIVADAMTKNVICCSPMENIWNVSKLINKYNIERLPVIENGKIVGIITTGQIIKHINQIYDSLTDMFNSTYIYRIAATLLNDGKDIIVIFLDINNFGAINKKLGHVYGDKCIKNTAYLLQSSIDNELDYACRYGGDEFVIVTNRKLSDAEQLAQKIINIVAQDKLSNDLHITVTAGISTGHNLKDGFDYDNYYQIAEQLINNASLAVAKAKETNIDYTISY